MATLTMTADGRSERQKFHLQRRPTLHIHWYAYKSIFLGSGDQACCRFSVTVQRHAPGNGGGKRPLLYNSWKSYSDEIGFCGSCDHYTSIPAINTHVFLDIDGWGAFSSVALWLYLQTPSLDGIFIQWIQRPWPFFDRGSDAHIRWYLREADFGIYTRHIVSPNINDFQNYGWDPPNNLQCIRLHPPTRGCLEILISTSYLHASVTPLPLLWGRCIIFLLACKTLDNVDDMFWDFTINQGNDGASNRPMVSLPVLLIYRSASISRMPSLGGTTILKS